MLERYKGKYRMGKDGKLYNTSREAIMDKQDDNKPVSDSVDDSSSNSKKKKKRVKFPRRRS